VLTEQWPTPSPATEALMRFFAPRRFAVQTSARS
jgi:hypothetical protein